MSSTQVVPDLHNSSHLAPGNQSSFFTAPAAACTSDYHTPDRTNPFRKMIENAYGPLNYDEPKSDGSKTLAHGDVMDKGFIDEREPRVTFAEVPTRVRYDARPSPQIQFHGYHSYMDNSHDSSGSSGVDNTEGQVEYSCADMSEALHSKTPSKFAPAHLTVDDDDATTTSGSYVVDPEDLCNEIDDLFFKDMVL